MGKTLIRLLGIVGLFLISSCGQDADSVLTNEESPKLLKYEFLYKGVTYHEMKGDIQQKLGELPELALYVDENGKFEYFDNYEELLKNACERNSYVPIEATTRASGESAATATLYKDINYKGGNISYRITSSGTRWANIPDLSSVGFYNNVSSARLVAENLGNPEYGTLFTVWDEVGYKGNSLVFNKRVNDRTMVWDYPNLAIVPRSIYGANWNDAIRSCKFYFYAKQTPPWGPPTK